MRLTGLRQIAYDRARWYTMSQNRNQAAARRSWVSFAESPERLRAASGY
jgi:hypothetical protein